MSLLPRHIAKHAAAVDRAARADRAGRYRRARHHQRMAGRWDRRMNRSVHA